MPLVPIGLELPRSEVAAALDLAENGEEAQRSHRNSWQKGDF